MMEQGWNRLMEKKPDTFMMSNFERLKAMCPPLKY
jgi:hypothetical protein